MTPARQGEGSIRAMASTGSRFAFIDGLRAIAALWVLLFHAYGALGIDRLGWPGMIDGLVAHGNRGVEIFFVLSGFVIACSVEGARVTGRFVANFALRRSLRLDPAYWLTILLTLLAQWLSRRLLGGGAGTGVGALDVAANFLYLNELLQRPAVVGVGWSLCFEIQFYLTFILLTLATERLAPVLGGEGRARLVAFGPLAVYAVLAQHAAVPTPLAGLGLGPWSMFFIGALAWWVVAGRVSARWFWIAWAAMVLPALARPSSRLFVAGGTALVIFLAGTRGGLERWLAQRPFQAVGRISYSVYLIHSLVIAAVVELPPVRAAVGGRGAGLLFLPAVAVVIAASHVFYRAIERPSHELSKRFRPRGAGAAYRSPESRSASL